jgi:hypothetical protein
MNRALTAPRRTRVYFKRIAPTDEQANAKSDQQKFRLVSRFNSSLLGDKSLLAHHFHLGSLGIKHNSRLENKFAVWPKVCRTFTGKFWTGITRPCYCDGGRFDVPLDERAFQPELALK